MRIAPEQVGLPAGSGRRTRGLRREEVAVLAGISPTWYTYLEQGRDIRPSADVLDALSHVLRLSEDERVYLFLLANGHGPVAPERPQERSAARHMNRILTLLEDVGFPVIAANLYTDVLSWNRVAAEWYTDFARLPPNRRNMLWWLLTDPAARERVVDWAEETRGLMAALRIVSASRPWDRVLAGLVDDLHEASPEFREWWAEHDVREDRERVRRIRLPGGEIREVEVVAMRASDGFHPLVLYIPVVRPEDGMAEH